MVGCKFNNIIMISFVIQMDELFEQVLHLSCSLEEDVQHLCSSVLMQTAINLPDKYVIFIYC